MKNTLNTLLNVNHIQVSYEQQQILNDINFELQQGEILCLLGPSGCGKTTILKSIAGLLPIAGGTISIDGNEVSSSSKSTPPEKRNLGLLFQDYALFPHLTVAQNIVYGISKLSKSEQQSRLEEMLDLVHLKGQQDKFPHQLSGGQQQRVALARSLAYKPDLLLLDEPFSNIDNKVKLELIDEVRDIIKQANVGAIFVSHSKEEAYAFADTVALINQGKVEQIGQSQSLYQHPQSLFVAEFMGTLNTFKLEQLPEASAASIKLKSEVELTPDTVLGLRPEHIYIAQANDEIKLEVKVAHKRFAGAFYIVSGSLQGSSLEKSVSFYASVDNKIEIGDVLTLSFNQQDCLVY